MPDYVATEAQFTVVKCVPRWLLTDDQQHLVHNIESQSPAIIVRAPTTMNVRMKTGLQNAVAAWNTALEAYGVDVGPRYQYVENDTPCSGQYCINTEIGEIDLGTECAEGTLTVDPSTGLILGSTITFPDDTAGWPQAFNTRLAAHELGHHLGLENNNSSCGTAYSLMKPVSCGASSGFPTAPTMSDHLPVARSAYMGQTRATCQ